MFRVVELDKVVEKAMEIHNITDRNQAFGIYKNIAPREHIDTFISIVKGIIDDCENKKEKLVVEGATSNVDIINEIFDGKQYVFCVLMAFDKDRQYERTLKRTQQAIENQLQISYPSYLIDDYIKNGSDGLIFNKYMRKWLRI